LRRDKVYEFLFVAPAIPITGAVGSPVNLLAINDRESISSARGRWIILAWS